MTELADAWRPWRAVAARILWHQYLSVRAERRAAAHEATRVGGECDLVVIGASAREGLTEDYLTVAVDASVPRATRCRARLQRSGHAPQDSRCPR